MRAPGAGAEWESANSPEMPADRKSTRLNSSHLVISYAVFCLKKKKKITCQLCNPHSRTPSAADENSCCSMNSYLSSNTLTTVSSRHYIRPPTTSTSTRNQHTL